MGELSDQFNASWASRDWGVEGIVEEATARRWFEKGYREALSRCSAFLEDQALKIAEQGERIAALEAKCALLAASLAQEEARSAEFARLLAEVAALKRYDPNGNRGWSRSTLTVNMPSELLERIDVAIEASKDRP